MADTISADTYTKYLGRPVSNEGITSVDYGMDTVASKVRVTIEKCKG